MDKHGLLIFDVDGTLYHTELSWVPATQRGFQEHGLVIPSKDKVLSFVGQPISAFYAWLLEQSSPETFPDLKATIDHYDLALISETGKLYDGVLDALTELRAAVAQMVICTNGPQEYAETIVNVHGLAPFFDKVRFRHPEDTSKPAMVKELLGQYGSRPAIVIGDRGDDIEAARQNGLLSIAALYGYGTADELKLADAQAGKPSDLPGLVRALFAGDQGTK